MARRLGQHFLYDPAILDRIAAAIDPQPGDRVLEIGPGRGTLTRRLLEHDVHVTAIEFDRALATKLAAEIPSVRVVSGDALRVDWVEAVGADRFKIVGNIPYHITTPLIDLAVRSPASLIAFLVQTEVADRVAAEPGTRAYGGLSVGVQLAADVERLMTVRPGSFRPPPKVGSTLLRLRPRPAETRPPEVGTPPFRRFVADLFGQRRRQLGRALRTVRGLSASEATRIVEAMGLPADGRAETLPPRRFVDLYRLVAD